MALNDNKIYIERVNQLIRERRSIHPLKYTGELIPKADIEMLLENANWAPTHKLTQPWFFKVFHQESLLDLINQMISIIKSTQQNLENFKSIESKIKKFEMFKDRISHSIAIIMRRDLNEVIPEIEEIAAVSCAVQNIYLSLNPLGLGGYWSTGGGCYSQEMHRYLKLKDGDKCLGFFHLGKYRGTKMSSKRQPIETKVEWVGVER